MMRLRGISRELRFGVCNHKCPAKMERPLYVEEKGVGRPMVSKESLALHWLHPCQERGVSLLPVGLC